MRLRIFVRISRNHKIMARTFDGTDDMIEFAGKSFIGNSTAFTISLWFRMTGTTNRCFYCESYTADGDTIIYIKGNENTAGDIEYGTINDAAGFSGVASGGIGINDGVWHHVVAVNYGSTSRELWVDGVSRGTDTATKGTVTTNQLYLGRQRRGTGAFFAPHNGPIANVGIWTRALRPREVTSLYKGYAPSFLDDSLVGDIPIIGNNSPEPDRRGGAVNGTVTGAVKYLHPRTIFPRNFR